ncbi:unnamed protein product [Orchesella dallaii]|uniref:Uncharacterized protein n=1 Tax=Orchesella dallaii TaxID=48710 RepID=A0ABP1QE73_9HEXA
MDKQSRVNTSDKSKTKKDASKKSRKAKPGDNSKNWRNYRHLHKQSRHKKLPRVGTKASDIYHYPYKRPVEKLLKRLKQERPEAVPPHVNIHRHRARRPSFIGGRGVEKEIQLIQKTLQKYGRKVQPKVGWEYNKRQKRLLLGFRHRKLDKGFRYFEPIKEFFPRHLKPNRRLPDAIFFFLNVIIFVTLGIFYGVSSGLKSLTVYLEDVYEYQQFKAGKNITDHFGHIFWRKEAPFEYYGEIHTRNVLFTTTIILIGFLGVYLADQMLHLIYVIGMLISIGISGIVAITVKQVDYCLRFMEIVNPLLELMLDNYYEKIDAVDVNGTLLQMGGKNVQIRTFKATNLMDRLQLGLQCCGNKGYEDYLSRNASVPPSCCTPLWNLNPYCSKVIPLDATEFKAKFIQFNEDEGSCSNRLETICRNGNRLLGSTAELVSDFHLVLYAFSLVALIMQARQIRQLKRVPHLRISAGSVSQSLQASVGNEATKGGGVDVLENAAKLTEKQTDHLQQIRRDSGLDNQEVEDDESSSSSTEIPVHLVNFTDMKNLQQFVDTEDKSHLEKLNVDKAVEGFAGRFNIVANKTLQNYVSGIFSTTFQNETNAALEAINQTLERQFAQHTTEYDWRKLLTKTKKKGTGKGGYANPLQAEKPTVVIKRVVASQPQPDITAKEDADKKSSINKDI